MFLLKILSLFLISFFSLRAENFSIMLSLAEQEALQEAHTLDQKILERVSPKTEAKYPASQPNQDVIFLSAVLYFSPEKWTILLNDQIITGLGYVQGIWIKKVMPDAIVFSLEEQNPLEFSLRINQSFYLKEKTVIEGDQRMNSEILIIDKVNEKEKI